MHTKIPAKLARDGKKGTSVPIWWKSVLTSQQLVQFCVMMVQAYLMVSRKCSMPNQKVSRWIEDGEGRKLRDNYLPTQKTIPFVPNANIVDRRDLSSLHILPFLTFCEFFCKSVPRQGFEEENCLI